MSEETAVCRGCGMKLKGKPYHLGGIARHPETNKVCESNFYGGYVCSDSCDSYSTSRQKRSIDEHNDPIGYYS